MSRLITAGIGVALLAMALCFVPLRANATVRKTTHAKTHVAAVHKFTKRRATNRRTTSRRSPHRVVRRRVASRRPAKAQRRVARAKYGKVGLLNASYKTRTRKKWRKPYRRVRYRRRYRHHVTLPRAPAPERTEQIQSALERGGYYSGNPNGRWDGGTQEALRRFQAANGLPATGKLDALSLQKLGLGSDVAGLSAPGRVITGNQSSSQPSSSSGSSPGPRTPGL